MRDGRDGRGLMETVDDDGRGLGRTGTYGPGKISSLPSTCAGRPFRHYRRGIGLRRRTYSEGET